MQRGAEPEKTCFMAFSKTVYWVENVSTGRLKQKSSKDRLREFVMGIRTPNKPYSVVHAMTETGGIL